MTQFAHNDNLYALLKLLLLVYIVYALMHVNLCKRIICVLCSDTLFNKLPKHVSDFNHFNNNKNHFHARYTSRVFTLVVNSIFTLSCGRYFDPNINIYWCE